MAISRVIYCALDRVKTSGVVAQDRRFVFGLEVVAFEDLVDFFHAIIEGNLMREVGGEHERFRADPLDAVSERFLIALAADEYFVAAKIIHRFALDAEAAVFQLSFQAIEHHGYPARAAFQETDAQGGECVEYAVDDHTRGGDG